MTDSSTERDVGGETPVRIHLVQVYVGPLPSYYPLFLSSCRFSPDVRFSIVSDREPPPHVPSNVTWVRWTLDEIRARLGQAVGTEVALEDGYKLCDFKPTFGRAFPDLIGDADYWGYIDPDVIVGDISGALAPALADRPDVLSTREDAWLTGALCLYRNTETVNALFLRAPSVPDVYRTPRCVRFAELCGRWRVAPGSLDDLVANGQQASMTDVVVDAAAEGVIRFRSVRGIAEPKTVGDGGEPFTIRVRDGVMRGDSERSFALVHLLFAKGDPWFRMPGWARVPDSFDVTERGVYAVGDRAGWVLSEPGRLLRGVLRSSRQTAERVVRGVRRRARPPEP